MLGVNAYGFEDQARTCVNYIGYSGRFKAVPGAPDYVLGYITLDDGRRVLVQDLRVRFRERCTYLDGSEKNILVFVDGDEAQGFVVDQLVDFYRCRTEVQVPWGTEILLEAVQARPFVTSLAKTVNVRESISFWLLKREELHWQGAPQE